MYKKGYCTKCKKVHIFNTDESYGICPLCNQYLRLVEFNEDPRKRHKRGYCPRCHEIYEFDTTQESCECPKCSRKIILSAYDEDPIKAFAEYKKAQYMKLIPMDGTEKEKTRA